MHHRFAFSLLVFSRQALAWGLAGEQTAAYVAQSFLKPDAAAQCQTILNDMSNDYLANIAPWADQYRYTPDGNWTNPFHYIAAHDNPPDTCDVLFARDCPAEGCIVTAIANYTEMLQDTTNTPDQRLEALRFLVNYVITITSPLHNEALDVRGSTLLVTWNGTQSNLHDVWDVIMPTTFAGDTTLSQSQLWAANLVTDINTGIYPNDTDWLSNLSLCWIITTAIDWSSDANAEVCNSVLADGVDVIQNEDLSGPYYQSAIPVINLQIAKAGYRLAAWLNLILTGEPGLEVPQVTTVQMCNTTALTNGGATNPV